MRRSYSGGAVPTTIAVGIDNVAPSITAAALADWPSGVGGPFTVTINRGEVTEEEILCSTSSGVTLSVLSRGYGGTSAHSHSPGESLEHTGSVVDFDEANYHVNSDTGVHGLAAGDGALVGTLKSQTLRGKTMSGTDNSFSNIPESAVTDLDADLLALSDAITAEVSARSSADAALTARVPVGSIIMYGGATAPAGWLLCDGAVYTQATYPALYAAIAVFDTAPDGSFAVPNLIGRNPVGAGAGHILAAAGGADSHQITLNQMPSHTHAIDHDHASFATSASEGSHTHTASFTQQDAASNLNPAAIDVGNDAGRYSATIQGLSDGTHQHNIDVPALTGTSGAPTGQGSQTSIDHRDAFLNVTFIIRAV